jgi:hypothetical protein
MAIVVFQFAAAFITAENATEAVDEPKKEAQLQELVFLVSPQDVHVDQEPIRVKSFSRFSGSFEPIFDSIDRGNILVSIWAPIN